MSEIKSSEELFRIFNLTSAVYADLKLDPDEIGFSVKRKYETDVRHHAIKGVSFEEVRLCIFRVALLKEKVSAHVHPLMIDVFTWVGGWTGSEEYSKRTLFYPIRLESDEYLYAGDSFKTLAKKPNGSSTTGMAVFEELYQKHLLPTRPLKGWVLRRRIWFPPAFYVFSNWIMATLKMLLKILTGRMLVYKDKSEHDSFYEDKFHDPVKPYSSKDIVLDKSEEIKAFNYSTTKPVLVSGAVCLIMIVVALNLSPLKDFNLKAEGLIYAATPILIFWILDTLFPLAIIQACNLLIRLKMKIFFRNLNI